MTKIAWQYNGVAPMNDIIDWCDSTFPFDTYHYDGWETIYFYNESCYVFFILKWL